MSNIKVLFFDIDHTLFSHTQHRIPAETWDCLKQMKDMGLKLFIATGRQYHEMFTLDEDWAFFDGYVTLNGSLCVDKNEDIIASFPIEGKARESVTLMFNSKQIALLVVEKDRMYANFHNDNLINAQKAIYTPLPQIAELSDNPVYQLIFFGERGVEEKVEEALPGCVATRWNDYAFDVISRKAGKDRGVKAVLDSYGFTEDECIVFGDGDNDISMLANLPNSVAMGNGTEAARCAASYVTTDIEDAGIRNALRYFGLI